jgi:toxin CcdB
MAQFDVYRNKDPATRTEFPLLLDLQADLLSDLAIRVVAPLMPAGTGKLKLLGSLTPELTVEANGMPYSRRSWQVSRPKTSVHESPASRHTGMRSSLRWIS